MPDESPVERQLDHYGAWLEEHLGTGLRPEVAVVDDDDAGTPGPSPGRRWAYTLLACAASIALVAVGIAMFSGSDTTARTRLITAAPAIPIEWDDVTTSLFDGDTPYSLAGSQAGFLALTRPAEQDANSTTFDTKIWYSRDGSTWTNPTTPIPTDTGLWGVGATSNALWVVATTYRDTTIGLRNRARIYRTTDGVHWTTLTPRVEVGAPLSDTGDVLVAQATADVMNGPYKIAASTNGQDWNFIDGASGLDGIGSVARVGGITYVTPFAVRGDSARPSVMFASRDGARWQQLPWAGGQLVGFGDDLLAVDESLDTCGIPTQGPVNFGLIIPAPGGTTTTLAPCDAAPTVHAYDPAARAWSEVSAATRPVGPARSAFISLGGQLLSATATFDGQFVVSTTVDGGATWQEEIRRDGLSIADRYQSPLVASNGRDVVLMASSAYRNRSIVAVGRLAEASQDPVETPIPTEAPGPTLSPDTPSPGATDPGDTFPPPASVSPDSSFPSESVPLPTSPDGGTEVTIAGLRSFIDMPRVRLASGASMDADWVVVNDTDRPVDLGDICVQEYMFHLEGSNGFQSYASSPDCVARKVVLAPGENRYRGIVRTTTGSCFTNPSQPVDSSCSASGPDVAGLPPGTYLVVLTGAFNGVPAPEPVPMTVVEP